jgi:cation diffusion facilitator CzcD-associated flavoprotein CzcO
MKTHTRVLVIGGGVVGCSVLYHLTKLGWSDIMLVERSELTSGSTWHAAGGFHTLNADTNMAALQGYTIRLYRELEELTGMSCGLHHVGGVTLAWGWRPRSSGLTRSGSCRPSPIPRGCWVRSTTRSTGIWTPPARPMPMRRPPAWPGPRSCCVTR